MRVTCEQRGAAESRWSGKLTGELPRGQVVLVTRETWAGTPAPGSVTQMKNWSP